MVETLFFADAESFSDWLGMHHKHTPEVWILFHKKGSGKPSQSWPEAVDVALCFGWIDGLRKSVDSDSYKVRFTPRKPNSVWSAVNVKKVEALLLDGKMRPEGIALYQSRKDTEGYSSQTRNVELDPVYAQRFQQHQRAWEIFSEFSPSYIRDAVWWVMSAKREETRTRRLEILISSSAKKQRVPALHATSPNARGV
ncbi:YdeI/OmpD-associated family protein [Leucobacter sp. UT-8R-CII-1-4]|uniref:YdeI/OmpD-associated family protein n=1 Tax=Leucobacter sp. UT-8R-CII-1-4 TaxID=3040075 RepID=UPI0024A7C599|nr:YdeI/OmpD-associated family protein [Leucobacter sp. UT-8R-CII-1-4]MDI6022682.1 YdeI/OmpD-associated family protein [Leucobacter sp. UT-8R-CII-1-4]